MNKKPEPLTHGIKNCQYSSIFNICRPFFFICNLTIDEPATATFHTANRWATLKKNSNTDEKINHIDNSFLWRNEFKITK